MTTHAIDRTEYQTSGCEMQCAIVCRCGRERTGATWAEAGAAYDEHLDEADIRGETIDYNPRNMDATPDETMEEWREWFRRARARDADA